MDGSAFEDTLLLANYFLDICLFKYLQFLRKKKQMRLSKHELLTKCIVEIIRYFINEAHLLKL